MELDFARAYLTRLSALPVKYSARYASERGRPETAHSESVALSSLLESGGILEESGACHVSGDLSDGQFYTAHEDLALSVKLLKKPATHNPSLVYPCALQQRLTIPRGSTVGVMKRVVADAYRVPVDAVRLVVKGRAMGKDEEVVEGATTECGDGDVADSELAVSLLLRPGYTWDGHNGIEEPKERAQAVTQTKVHGEPTSKAQHSAKHTVKGTLAKPHADFWPNLRAFLRSQFPSSATSSATLNDDTAMDTAQLVFDRFQAAYQALVKEEEHKRECEDMLLD